MIINGIDTEQFGLDYRCDIISDSTTELNVKDCIAFTVSQKGNVPVEIGGNIAINDTCGQREFPSFMGLPYLNNQTLKWMPEGIADPDARIELVRIYILPRK